MEPIIERGYLYRSAWEINLSSIFSELIRVCGKLVDNYNSDLIYDIEKINTELKVWHPSQGSKIHLIGFREMGVDHFDFIQHRCNDLGETYRAIYSVSIEKEHDDNHIKVTLQKHTISEAKCLIKYLTDNPPNRL